MICHTDPQGLEAWLESRKGCITGSRFHDARDHLADKAEKPAKLDKKTGEIITPAVPAQRGAPSEKMKRYAYDVARERCGGTAPSVFSNKAMQFGTEQEPLARVAYEALTGNLVEEVGFITDDDGIFGVSVDGLIDDDGVLEIKTMVSSDTLFTAIVDGDISAYIDQCIGYLWLLGRQWVDLVLWAPDLESIGLHLTVRRITRDEADIELLEADLLEFATLVRENEAKLRQLAAAKLAVVDGLEIMELTLDVAPALAAPEVVEVVQVETFEPPAPIPLPLLDMFAELAEVEPDAAVELISTWRPAPLTAQDIAGGVVDAEVEPACEAPHRTAACSAAPTVERMTVQAPAPPGAGATLRLGQITERLGFNLTADFMRQLGFEPVATDKSAKLYRVADFDSICAALILHISDVRMLQAA